MTQLIELHPTAFAIAFYFVFSAVIGGMPDPDVSSSVAYRWAYRSLHILAGNITTAVQAKFPEMTIPAGSSVEHKETTTVTTPTPP